jgi:hypothetical protein
MEREIEECFARLRRSLDDRERAVMKEAARRTLHKRQALEKQRDWVNTKQAEGARVRSMATRLATASEEELVLYSAMVLQQARKLQLDSPIAAFYDDPTRLAATDALRLVVNIEHEIDRLHSIGSIKDEDEAKLHCWGWDEIMQPALRHARPSVAETHTVQSPPGCPGTASPQQTIDEIDAATSGSATSRSDWGKLIFPELPALSTTVELLSVPSGRHVSSAVGPDRTSATPTSYRSDSRLLQSPPMGHDLSRGGAQHQATGTLVSGTRTDDTKDVMEAPADFISNFKLAQKNISLNWDNAPLVDVRRTLYRKVRAAAGHHGDIEKLNPYTKGWVTEVWQPGAELYGQGVLSFYTLDDWDSGLCWSCCRERVFTTLRECFGLAHPWSSRRASSSRYSEDDSIHVDRERSQLATHSSAGEPNLATAV